MLKAKTVDHIRLEAVPLSKAIREQFNDGSRPARERVLLLGLADALNRVLLALANELDSVPEKEALAAATTELQQAKERGWSLLSEEMRAGLDGVCEMLAALATALPSGAHRGARVGVPRTNVLSSPPSVESLQEAAIAEAAPPMRFGASAPQSAVRGEPFIARFIAYTSADAAKAAAALKDSRALTQAVLDIGSVAVPRGTRVRVALSADGLRVEGEDSASQDFVWQGEQVLLMFEVAVPKKLRATATLLKFDISVDGLLLGRVRLQLEIVHEASRVVPPQEQHSLDHLPARSAFASYSSKDRERVLDRLAAIRIAFNTDVFLDCHDLRPGEKWEAALAREIDARETFLLFWSGAARDSKWVTWEWERALKEKGLDAMQIHPLENAVPVPRALESVHFGDPYMDLRAAAAARGTPHRSATRKTRS